MSLEHGVLGYLSIKPLTGYDIKKLFNISATFFWPADQAQIYRALKNLTDNGLVEKKEPGGNEKRIEYCITDQGRETLQEWLMDVSMANFIERSPVTMQLFFSGTISSEDQLAVLNKQIETNHNFVQKLKKNYEENGPTFACTVELDDPDRRLESATYASRWGIYRGEAYTAFLEEIKAEILAKKEDF